MHQPTEQSSSPTDLAIVCLKRLEEAEFPIDKQIRIACWLDRWAKEQGVSAPYSPDLRDGFASYVQSLTEQLRAHACSTEESLATNNNSILLAELGNRESLSELSDSIIKVIEELKDVIPSWMLATTAQDICNSLLNFVVHLEEFHRSLDPERDSPFIDLKESLTSDYCNGEISEQTKAVLSELIARTLAGFSGSDEPVLLQLLDITIEPVETILRRTLGELEFIKQIANDLGPDENLTMKLLFPEAIASFFSDVSKFLGKHLRKTVNGECTKLREKTFFISKQVRDLLNKMGENAPLGEILLTEAANCFATRILSEDFKKFYEWKGKRKDGNHNLEKQVVEIDSNLRWSDNRIINTLCPPEAYTQISGAFIYRGNSDHPSIRERVKTLPDFISKMLIIILDNLSREQDHRNFSVALGKKSVNGSASWICDKYGLMFVGEEADRTMNNFCSEISQGRLPGFQVLREENITAKNGFRTRKLIVRYLDNQTEACDPETKARNQTKEKDHRHQGMDSPSIIIEIQFRTPDENEAAEINPQLAHDVYKKRLENRLTGLKRDNPAIEFVAEVLEWAVCGADKDPPTNIRGFSCKLTD